MSLELRDVWHRFPGSSRDVLRRIDLLVPAGTTVAVTAPSGAGKTTLLAIAGLLLRPSRGQVLHDVREGSEPVNTTAWVLQTVNLVTNHTAAHNVALPLLARGMRNEDAERQAVTMLETLGIGHLGSRVAGTLSGGEAQRVGVARAMVTGPSLILADEPTANLDPETAFQVAEALLRGASGASVLVATHDPRVASMADRQALLLDGQLIEGNRVASV